MANPMVKLADTFPGSDAGVKIAAAIAALPAGIGGLVDATAPSTYHSFFAYCAGHVMRFDENGFSAT